MRKQTFLPTCVGMVLLLILLTKAFAQKPEALTVAVSGFSSEGLPTKYAWLGNSFAEGLIEQLSASRRVRVVEREYLKTLMDELQLQMSGAVDPATAVQVGRLTGAEVFVFGSVAQFQQTLIARARAVSVEQGEILGTCEAHGDQNQLFQIQKNLGKKLAITMALEAALSQGVPTEASKLRLTTLENLNRVKTITATFPLIGLDPARRRKQSEYYFTLTLCENILTEAPNFPEALYHRGLLYLQLGDDQKAEEDIQSAKALSPEYRECHLALGNLHFIQRQYYDAENVFRAYVADYPHDARGWYALGRTLMEKREYPYAIEALILACENTPYILEAESNLRVVLQSATNQKIMAQLSNTKPDIHAAAMIFHGFWKQQLGRIYTFIPLVLSSHPNLYIGHYASGMKALDERNKQKAFSAFRTCLSLRPNFPEVHREMGLVALDLGNARRGKQHLNIYLKTASFIDDYERVQRALKKHE